MKLQANQAFASGKDANLRDKDV